MLYPTFQIRPIVALHTLLAVYQSISLLCDLSKPVCSTHRFEKHSSKHDCDECSLDTVLIYPPLTLVQFCIYRSVCRNPSLVCWPMCWIVVRRDWGRVRIQRRIERIGLWGVVEIIVCKCGADVVCLRVGRRCHGHDGCAATAFASVRLPSRSSYNLGIQPGYNQ